MLPQRTSWRKSTVPVQQVQDCVPTVAALRREFHAVFTASAKGSVQTLPLFSMPIWMMTSKECEYGEVYKSLLFPCVVSWSYTRYWFAQDTGCHMSSMNNMNTCIASFHELMYEERHFDSLL